MPTAPSKRKPKDEVTADQTPPPENTSGPQDPDTEGPPATSPEVETSNKRRGGKPKAEENGQAEEKEKKPKRAPKVPKREVIYEAVKVKTFSGDSPLTAAHAKKLLGWEEESDNVKFGSEYFLQYTRDVQGAKPIKVRLSNNTSNRPYYAGVMETLRQEILRKRWRFNGETIIIGHTGQVLTGQHTLVALVLAAMKWHDQEGQYSEWWKTEPTIEKIVVFGIDEADEVVNTIDTGKTRSLADVLFRSETFSKVSPKDRIALARMSDYAVRTLWQRTGANLDPFAPKRTHAESLNFIARHPKLIPAVRHVFEEEGDEHRISRYISPGTAAALLYLMGCSLTERDGEDEEDRNKSYLANPTEKFLNFDLWEKALEFWVLLAGNNEKLRAVNAAMAAIESISRDERAAIIVKAWNLWVDNKKVTPDGLALEYVSDEDDFQVLGECPIVGGIDLGKPVVSST